MAVQSRKYRYPAAHLRLHVRQESVPQPSLPVQLDRFFETEVTPLQDICGPLVPFISQVPGPTPVLVWDPSLHEGRWESGKGVIGRVCTRESF